MAPALSDYCQNRIAETETETTAETEESTDAAESESETASEETTETASETSQKQKAQQRQRPYLNKKEKDLPMERNSRGRSFYVNIFLAIFQFLCYTHTRCIARKNNV